MLSRPRYLLTSQQRIAGSRVWVVARTMTLLFFMFFMFFIPRKVPHNAQRMHKFLC